jgi:hypothetical protein
MPQLTTEPGTVPEFSFPADWRRQILKIVLIVGPKLFIEPGTKAPALFKLLSVSEPRIVNNFAASASPGYELSSFLAR